MTKRLKRGEALLRFILDPKTTKKESRSLLTNASEIHLNILGEIFYNLLKNQDILSKPLKDLISKKKRLLTKFITYTKRKNKLNQRRFLKRNLNIIHLILKKFKKIILQFL